MAETVAEAVAGVEADRHDIVPTVANYLPHLKQAEAHKAFLVDGYKRATLFWGRQVGKSLWSVKHLEMAACLKQGQYFIVFRTHKHAKDVMWRQYLHAIPKDLIDTTNSTELIITFKYIKGAFYFPGIGWQAIIHDTSQPPSTIQLLGSDYAFDHTGRKADGMIFDEYQDQDPQNWETVYRHYFTTTKGWACFMGTARGFNHWYDRLEYAKEKYRKTLEEGEKKTWFYLEATWRDNPVVDAEYMAEQREEAEETGQLDTYMQEVELQFRTAAGSVYPMFDRNIHVISPNDKRIPDDGTLYITWDFGWVEGHPTAINFIHIDNHGRWFITDEIHGLQIRIDDIIEMIQLKTSEKRIQQIVADSARPDLIDAAKVEASKKQMFFPITGAPKRQGSVAAGITLLGTKLMPKLQLLGSPEPDVFVTSNCAKTIFQLENYRYREVKKDRPATDAPIKMHDDHCFVENTMISTTTGKKAIQDLTSEDVLVTPLGNSRVLANKMTGIKPVFKSDLYTSTFAHKVPTNRGVVQSDELRYTDVIWKENLKQFTSMEYLIAGILNQRREVTDYIINGLLTRSLEAKLELCIKMYGNSIMEKFQQDMKSITQMDTMTTQLEALNLLVNQNITVFTTITSPSLANSLSKMLGSMLLCGIKVQQDENGIVNTLKNCGLNELYKLYNVLVAEKSLTPLSQLELSTVEERAKQQPSGDAEVYNLASENGMYFANGVLVSNCDGLRYLALYLKFGLVKQAGALPPKPKFNQFGI